MLSLIATLRSPRGFVLKWIISSKVCKHCHYLAWELENIWINLIFIKRDKKYLVEAWLCSLQCFWATKFWRWRQVFQTRLSKFFDYTRLIAFLDLEYCCNHDSIPRLSIWFAFKSNFCEWATIMLGSKAAKTSTFYFAINVS